MVTAVISYGHSMDSKEENNRRLSQGGSEFTIDISDGTSDMTNELFFLPDSDHDFHSPIWIAIKLPEMARSRWKNAMKPVAAKIRRSEKRRDNNQETQDHSWSSSSQWQDTQDHSWRSSRSSASSSSWNQSWSSNSWRSNPPWQSSYWRNN